MSYDPTKDQFNKTIRAIHDNLVNRLPRESITLEVVADAVYEQEGVRVTPGQVAAALNETTADPKHGGDGRSIFSRHAQGRSGTSEQAHQSSLKAFESSEEAKSEGSAVSHGSAAGCHHDAATAHRRAARFHDRAEEFHTRKAAGDTDVDEPKDE